MPCNDVIISVKTITRYVCIPLHYVFFITTNSSIYDLFTQHHIFTVLICFRDLVYYIFLRADTYIPVSTVSFSSSCPPFFSLSVFSSDVTSHSSSPLQTIFLYTFLTNPFCIFALRCHVRQDFSRCDTDSQVVLQIVSLSGSLSPIPHEHRNKSLRLLRNASAPAVSPLSSYVLRFTLVLYPARLITHLFTDRIDRNFLPSVEALPVSQKRWFRHQQRRKNPCKFVVDNLNDAKKSLFSR